MVLFPEHRFYGKSMPYGSREKAYKNSASLAHLTAEQALADFAVLVTDLKRNLSAEACPVVLFGGSYGGMLAAWLRLKYPHIAIGALASSAPILQFENIVPSETFYDIVSHDFRRESVSCFDYIKNSWEAIEAEGEKADGLSHLTRTFHLCQKLNSTDDLSNWLSSAYSYLAMVDYPYPSEFLMPFNIIFSNGLLDPWSGGSVLQNVSETVIALVTKLGAHHIDLRAATNADPDWLLEQRASEINVIKEWIKIYYQETMTVLSM
ncbi:hypothetical protein MKW94_009997 [Papaver nudicaule]|uniref:Lysosomal Pro-X carboxypeptidase n=1 Tax=Papaver nudicaule TaxID=74823 RepID=A0AA41S1V8_PAPNU|nr:hypothetical protein [Papaver nudicaule]